MKRFASINNLVGWLVFAISLIVYTLTVEETGSLWDCGEFTAVAYKLQVSHPPGAPLYILLGRIFSLFAFNNTDQVAMAINMLSVVSSAFTILFLFWTIVLLVQKLIPAQNEKYRPIDSAKMMIAGAVGALAYTFSDSFWFSASEAEVYATSSFFTAFVFWAMLKWEHIKAPSAANRWLILIFYMMGLSIGTHLLNLTALPALALIYYFNKTTQVSTIGILKTLAIAFGLIFSIMIGVIQGLPSMAGAIEIFFVNNLGLFFGSGVIFFTILLFGGLIYGIYKTHLQKKVLLNTFLLGFFFVIIGYMTYLIIPIRSSYNPPIDENDPEDVISFLSYLKREQYGDRPLLYGNTYEAQGIRYDKSSPLYRKGEDKYELYDYRYKVVYAPKDNILFPRIYSKQAGHPDLYKKWMRLKDNQKPNFIDNLYYLVRYQINHMYFRYFMWNFSGRESDIKEADWLMPWDNNEDAPYELKINKGYSNFYMLPFILGILGLFFHYSHNRRIFFIVLTLFILTGLGIVFYLNAPPVEPRERDYTYVGSFYAFAIWIGFGFIALLNWFQTLLNRKTLALVLAAIISFFPAFLMARNGWDNHDRSNRYHSIGQARNALASCAPNAILFTGGDNDTFPLWYVQEVEGYRTDVRVIVLSYFNTSWYIDQMRRAVYQSEAVPLALPQKIYFQGSNDYISLYEKTKQPVNVAVYLELLKRNHPDIKAKLQSGGLTNVLISRNYYLDLDDNEVDIVKTYVPENKISRITKRMNWKLKDKANGILKSDLAILDIIVNNHWERPIYFNHTSINNINLDLSKYVFLEGMTYRLLPIEARLEEGKTGEVNADIMLKNIENFDFRGLDDANTYNDEDFRRFVYNERHVLFRLAEQLYRENKIEEAIRVLRMSKEKMIDAVVPYDYLMTNQISLYYRLGLEEEGEELARILQERSVESLDYWAVKNPFHSTVQLSFFVLYNLSKQYGEVSNQIQIDYNKMTLDTLNSVEGLEERLVLLKEKGDIYKQRYDSTNTLLTNLNDRIQQARARSN